MRGRQFMGKSEQQLFWRVFEHVSDRNSRSMNRQQIEPKEIFNRMVAMKTVINVKRIEDTEYSLTIYTWQKEFKLT